MTEAKNQLFKHIDSPEFEFANVKCTLTVEDNFDYGQYAIEFEVIKTREGDQLIEMASPHQGSDFEVTKVRLQNDVDLIPEEDPTCEHFKKYIFHIPDEIKMKGHYKYTIFFREKLSIQTSYKGRLFQTYSVVFKRTFGAVCRHLELTLILPKKTHLDFAHPDHKHNFEDTFSRTNIHKGDPTVYVFVIRHGLLTKGAESILKFLGSAIVGSILTIVLPKVILSIIGGSE